MRRTIISDTRPVICAKCLRWPRTRGGTLCDECRNRMHSNLTPKRTREEN